MSIDDPTTADTIKIAVTTPDGDRITAELITSDTVAIVVDDHAVDAVLDRHEWRAFRDAVNQLLDEPTGPTRGGCAHTEPGTGYRCALIGNHVGPHTTHDTVGRIVASWRNEADA